MFGFFHRLFFYSFFPLKLFSILLAIDFSWDQPGENPKVRIYVLLRVNDEDLLTRVKSLSNSKN